MCCSCSKTFPSQESLKAHEKIHQMPNDGKCLECNKSFHSVKQYRIHMSMLHNVGDTYFLCSICSRKFSRKCYMIEHEVTAHGIDHPMRDKIKLQTGPAVRCDKEGAECPVCGEHYKDTILLRKHMNTEHKLGLTYQCLVSSIAAIPAF